MESNGHDIYLAHQRSPCKRSATCLRAAPLVSQKKYTPLLRSRMEKLEYVLFCTRTLNRLLLVLHTAQQRYKCCQAGASVASWGSLASSGTRLRCGRLRSSQGQCETSHCFSDATNHIVSQTHMRSGTWRRLGSEICRWPGWAAPTT